VIVELLGAIRISDVPPALGPDGVASPIMSRDGRPGAWSGHVLELGNEAVAVQAVWRGVKPQSSIKVG
jgi:hypothetical protein